jgi:hypothetical protein
MPHQQNLIGSFIFIFEQDGMNVEDCVLGTSCAV